MTNVPFLSLKEQTAALRSQFLEAIAGVVDTQGFANGPAVAAFEQQLSRYLGGADVVAVNTGTTSLHAALITAGVKPGDEVITTPLTWISTSWAISYCGATPVFVEVDERTAQIDTAQIEGKITPKTKAILPVHLYGMPANLDALTQLSQRHNIPLIEDCAQSVGAKYRGKHTGTFGLVNATSFYPGKNLGAFGEGGACFTSNAEIAARIRSLRDHAQSGRHNHVEIGYNWRMDGIQGAVLSIKLTKLDEWNNRRKQIGARYLKELAGLSGLRMLQTTEHADPIWHIFPVFYARRDELRANLEKRGVATGVHYPTPVHLQPAYAYLGKQKGAFPIAERLGATEVSLPMFPEMTDAQVDKVVAEVRAAVQELPL